MYQHQLQFLHSSERMLKGFSNNSSSAFAMENLLASGKLTPENLVLNLHQSRVKASQECKGEPEELDGSDRLSLDINTCLRGRCSNCGRLDCNIAECRGRESLTKDSKPVLKFSVSAILGDQEHGRNLHGGKHMRGFRT